MVKVNVEFIDEVPSWAFDIDGEWDISSLNRSGSSQDEANSRLILTRKDQWEDDPTQR